MAQDDWKLVAHVSPLSIGKTPAPAVLRRLTELFLPDLERPECRLATFRQTEFGRPIDLFGDTLDITEISQFGALPCVPERKRYLGRCPGFPCEFRIAFQVQV